MIAALAEPLMRDGLHPPRSQVASVCTPVSLGQDGPQSRRSRLTQHARSRDACSVCRPSGPHSLQERPASRPGRLPSSSKVRTLLGREDIKVRTTNVMNM